jgi:segregation and condensation protein B
VNPHQIVEAVLFASDAPITADEIARADEHLDEDQVEMAIRQLQAEYDDAERSFQIVELAEGYQVLTRPEFAPYLERFDNVPRPSRLSGPALETLAIIAYRQPLGRMEIEYIRGVGAQGVLKTLLDREMIEAVGRAEGLGRPVLYGTTRRFLEHFGLKSLEDLPHPEELPVVLRERIPLGPEEPEQAEGEAAGAEEGGGEDGVAAAAAAPPDAEEAHASGDAGEATPDAEEARRGGEAGEAPPDLAKVPGTGDAGTVPPGAPGDEEAPVGGETPDDDILS